MPRYRVTLLPRQRGPFNEPVIVESGAPPRFEGPVVIVTMPVGANPNGPGPRPNEPSPLWMAWPLDMTSAVIVDELPERPRERYR